jgi:hypothetical protein
VLARIVANYDLSRHLNLTPGMEGRWGDVQFSIDPAVKKADYLIVLNYSPEPEEFLVPEGNTWLLMQEPAVDFLKHLHRGKGPYDLVLTSDPDLHGSRYVHAHPCLTTMLPDSYDDLIAAVPPTKTATLSWVTSHLRILPGHRARMEFLEQLRPKVPFDLFGRGFTSIENKAEGLIPYRYSIAFENWCSPFYWSEKLTDCFLTWTVPIYYGCSRVHDFFPEKSIVLFDPRDPDAIARIEHFLETDVYEDRLDALNEARRLFLDRYQFFPFLAAQITAHAIRTGLARRTYKPVRVAPPRAPLGLRAERRLRPPLSRAKQALRRLLH